MEKLLSGDSLEFDRLAAENMETITSYGDGFMESVSRDACDGHHVGRVSKFCFWMRFGHSPLLSFARYS